MISKSKLGMLAVAATMSIAAPAFADGMETGTAADTYGWNSPQANAISGGSSGLNAFASVAHRRSGLHAFARVPRFYGRPGWRAYDPGWRAYDMAPGAASGSDNPSATGGGSVGYNRYNGRDS